MKNKAYVLTRDQYTHHLADPNHKGCIEFVSLQDMKGSIYFGGKYDKLHEVADLEWDLLVIDEAHEGVDTYKTDVAFDHIKRRFTLHLSGTPFKALANNKFDEKAIFNWTYADVGLMGSRTTRQVRFATDIVITDVRELRNKIDEFKEKLFTLHEFLRKLPFPSFLY